jgi:hypothetical protein
LERLPAGRQHPIIHIFQLKALPVYAGHKFFLADAKKRMARNEQNNRERPTDIHPQELQSSSPGDLPDSPEDEAKMKNEETFIDLPDVADIPGQENVTVPSLDAIGDTTIASDDEEGVGVFDLDDSEDFTEGAGGDVTPDERRTLADSEYMPTRDEDNLRRARMDNTDFEGTTLNEGSFGEEHSGRDLDVPGSTDETRTDAMGQGDEENKNYSLSGNDGNDD